MAAATAATAAPDHPDRTKQRKGRKVRVVVKIKGVVADPNAGLSVPPWISVSKPNGDASDSVTVSFGEQSASRRESYDVDFCYEQNEGNDVIFAAEIKPLIPGVFDGRNATIIASGARGSGKTHMIQGTNKELGLAVLAMAEILSMAEENGKSIAISVYEIYQDRVYDVLDPKPQEVLVLEDAVGKIQLKGLSQIPVTSMSEFQKLYARSSRKPVQKISTEVPHRCHKGLMVYVSSSAENTDGASMGKMNFVDLAGYEDARRMSSNGHSFVENTKINNKTIHAVHDVIYSLNANESHVPYRGSKLTRMLQDSLGWRSRILLVTCLNSKFCQNSMCMLSLASRSCQATSRGISESTKKANSLVRSMLPSSHKGRTNGSTFSTAKKQTAQISHFSGKKANSTASALKARKLFDEASHPISDKVRSSDDIPTTQSSVREVASCLDIIARIESSGLEVERLTPVAGTELAVLQEDLSSLAQEDVNSVSAVETSLLAVCSTLETSTPDKAAPLNGEENNEAVTPKTKALTMVEEETGENIDKENNKSLVNEVASPTISAQLQELSNNLKLICSSTQSYLEIAPKSYTSLHDHPEEPRTPEQSMRADETGAVASFCTPWEKFSARSSGVKNKLVDEYLRFLNSANKEELKKLKGIGEKRATYILELREETPEPFKSLDDLQDIGLSVKQVKAMVGKEAAGLFN